MNQKFLTRMQNRLCVRLGSPLGWLLFVVIALAACTPSTTENPQPITTLPYTPPATEVAIEPTPTLSDGTAVPPTATVNPTQDAAETAVPAATQTVPATGAEPVVITFPAGEISSTLSGTLAVGSENDVYTFGAAANQVAEITVTSGNQSANFSLVGLADGQPYKRFENEDRSWNGTLLSSGNYQLTVTSLSRPIDYTLTLTIYPQELALPQTLPELAEWIGQQRQNGTPAADVQQILSANGWLGDWQEVDLTGDGQVEWLVVLQQQTGAVFGPLGDVAVITPAGLAYRHYDKFVDDGGFRLPTIEYSGDMTGDNLPEVAILTEFCGAHTCNHFYDIVGAPTGTVQSLVPTVGGEFPHPAISMMSSEVTFADDTADGRIDLIQHGGFISSVGAGPYQRGYTEVWGWSPTQAQFVSAETILDPSNYRFHLLYEANDLFDAGEYAVAIPKYVEVVENENLEDGVGLINQESTYAYSRQFAAFRLMVAYMQLGDMDKATVWSDWLYSNYPDTAIEDAVITFWEDYNFNHSVAAACTAVTIILNTLDEPTGPLADLGYALPSLTAESVCPIQ